MSETMYGATFSDDRCHRYTLWRKWSLPVRRQVLWIMLNPSTADEAKDDPTIRKCIAFSKAWGFDALLVCNLFALRATKPLPVLAEHDDPVGALNDEHISRSAKRADRVVLAWGVNGQLHRRGVRVVEMLSSLQIETMCLGETQAGEPKHPLYLPYSTELASFSVPREVGAK